MKAWNTKSKMVRILDRTMYAGVAIAMSLGVGGCFYSRTVDTEPPPAPAIVQVPPAPAPVVVQTTPTVPTNPTDEQHQVTTSWGPNGTVQKQTTTIADPNGVPVQKQTTTTWQPSGAAQTQSTSTTTTY
jgi:cytoskeletal protein RodZ